MLVSLNLDANTCLEFVCYMFLWTYMLKCQQKIGVWNSPKRRFWTLIRVCLFELSFKFWLWYFLWVSILSIIFKSPFWDVIGISIVWKVPLHYDFGIGLQRRCGMIFNLRFVEMGLMLVKEFPLHFDFGISFKVRVWHALWFSMCWHFVWISMRRHDFFFRSIHCH